MQACQFEGNHRYPKKILPFLKKDFWKFFVDKNGNELR
jgi:hypothetical protein